MDDVVQCANRQRYAATTNQRPTLSCSLPPVPVDDTLISELRRLLERTQDLYESLIVYYAPDGAKLPLPIDESVLLPYSLSSGRAMIPRAIQCQSHVEIAFTSNGAISFTGSSTILDTYLDRLEQLSRAIDVVNFVLLHGHVTDSIALDSFTAAWEKHAISQRNNVYFIDLSASPRAWEDLSSTLESQRGAWN